MVQALAGLALADVNPARPSDGTLRAEVVRFLASGLKTLVWPRAETSDDVNAIVASLARIAPDDLSVRLTVVGMTDHVVEAHGMEQACETCMYYLQRRRFCELPELMLPVEADWSCGLWRI